MSRIVILSDTHLGRPNASAGTTDALRPLWEGATNLIINGDLAEIHHPNYKRAASEQVLRLHELCVVDGAELTLLSGNHDAYITDVRHLSLARDTVFVTHGDVLHPAVAPWSPAAGRMRRTHEVAMSTLEPGDRSQLQGRLWASQRASISEWNAMDEDASHSGLREMALRPWAIAAVLSYWWVIPDLAARFVEEHMPEASFMVFGHTHRPGIWQRRGRTIINTGSFGFPGHPRAVVIEDNVLKVSMIRHRGARWHLDANPLAQFDLPQPPANASSRPADNVHHVDHFDATRNRPLQPTV